MSVETLLADLDAARQVDRETAAARLTILGPRVVERLIALLDSPASPAARTAVLNTLAVIGDTRAVKPALHATSDANEDVAVAAVTAVRAFLGTVLGADVVDRLTATALDRSRSDAIRVATVAALGGLNPTILAPLRAALRDDPSEAVRRAAAIPPSTSSSQDRDPIEELEDADQDPEALRRLIPIVTATAPLTTLLAALERARERGVANGDAREAWMAVRGAAHVALARRGSRLAVYDLREAIEGARAPLPADFMAAVAAVGDQSCLEPLASAYRRAGPGGKTSRADARDAWWRDQLADAFRAIVRRQRLTRRHATLRKIERSLLDELWAGR